MSHLLLYSLQVLSVDHSPLIDQILSIQEREIKALKLLEVIADADEVESNTDDEADDNDNEENCVLSGV